MDPDPDSYLAPAPGLDLDPALFVSDSQDAKQRFFLSKKYFAFYFLKGL
jgi:hypothetical protein